MAELHLLLSCGRMNGTVPNYILKCVSEGWTTYHELAANGDDVCLSKLYKSIKCCFKKDHLHGNTPLHEAAKRGYSRCIIILCNVVDHVQVKTNIDLKNNDGFSALHLAAQYGHNQCCRELLLRGSSPSIYNNFGDTPLHTACRYGHAGVLRILLSAFSNSILQNNNGDTALHIACAMGKRKLTKILLESQSSIDIKNVQNETPLDIAKRKRYIEIVSILKSNTPKMKEIDKKDNPTLFTPGSVFSPYGCHSYLESNCILFTNVEDLSKIKLENGEQYFFNLAGNIQRGPKCISHKCYCKPLIK